MEWTAAAVGQRLIASPRGDIEDGERDLFLENLRQAVSEAVARSVPLIIDLAAVGHMSASALMALTIARKDAVAGGVRIILARPGAALRKILEISRYQLIFDIIEDPNDGGE